MTFNVCNVYAVDSIGEFESLIASCGWTIEHDPETHLAIVRWRSGAITDIKPPVKGLIYNKATGQIMAAGIPVPLENMPENAQIVAHSRALDGVSIRFWFNGKEFTFSTSGMIVPGEWQDHDIATLVAECLALKQVDLEKLNINYSYQTIMEHPDIPNIYRSDEPRITLIRATDAAGNLVYEGEEAFKYVNGIYPPEAEPEVKPNDDAYHTDRDTFGVVYHLDDGNTYRKLSANAQAAMTFRPNYSSVWQHWIYHVMGTKTADWGFNGIYWYKRYFPWNATLIDGLCHFFLATVPPPEQEEILGSAMDLKKLVEKYMNDLHSIEWDWTYTAQPDSTQVVVTVPFLGDFPDEESASAATKWFIAHPAEIYRMHSRVEIE